MQTNFVTKEVAQDLASKNDTPLFIYSKDLLVAAAHSMLQVPAPFGLTVRFAMKANPNPEVLSIFNGQGIKIDASSGFEAEAAMKAGYSAEDILLTSQQIPHNLRYLVEQGVQYNATSLHQLETYAKTMAGSKYSNVSIRINPGIGSGHSAKVNVGGPTSSFGIWHEYIPKIYELVDKYSLHIVRLHTHIGSGADPAIWQQAAEISLKLVRQFEEVTTINLGGGFKIARVEGENEADISSIGKTLANELEIFANAYGRKLRLELEPGNFLTANAGVLLARVEDIVDTGVDGYKFIKLNTGMNDIMRPSLYGAQHPISVLNDSKERAHYVVVGHNCESGDLLSPVPGDPEILQTRELSVPQIGDLVVIGGAGAYCASMAAHGYNSFPNANEVVV